MQEREPICVKEKLKISHKAHLGNHPWNVHNTHFEKSWLIFIFYFFFLLVYHFWHMTHQCLPIKHPKRGTDIQMQNQFSQKKKSIACRRKAFTETSSYRCLFLLFIWPCVGVYFWPWGLGLTVWYRGRLSKMTCTLILLCLSESDDYHSDQITVSKIHSVSWPLPVTVF